MTIGTAEIETIAGVDGLMVNFLGLGADDSPSIEVPFDSNANSIQSSGTFTATATYLLQGSLDGVTFANLADATGAVIILNAASQIFTVHNIPRYLKLDRLFGGDGSTDVDVKVFITKGKPPFKRFKPI